MSAWRFILWRESDRRYLALAAVLSIALLAIIVTFTYVYSFSRVDGGSMLPALHDGDRLLLTRGYDAPHRGDIVSFRTTDRRGTPIRVIKRVIALSGDEVFVVGDVAYVNGAPSDAAPAPVLGPDPYTIGPFTVPSGTVFVMGDNRPWSYDSRYTGPVALETVTGRVVAIVFPPERIGPAR